MNKFEKYRVHFDIGSNGLIKAHSDPIKVEEIEEYIEVFGCGRAAPYNATGVLYWIAEAFHEDKNSRRLAKEWLASSMPKIFPRKAARIREMLVQIGELLDESH